MIDQVAAHSLQRLASHHITLAFSLSSPSPPTSNHHGRSFEIPSAAREQGGPAFVITLRRPWWPAWRIWERQVHFRCWRGAAIRDTGAVTVTVTTTTVRKAFADYRPDGCEPAQHNDVLGQPVSAAATAAATTPGIVTTNTTALEAARARVAHGSHGVCVCPSTGFLQ